MSRKDSFCLDFMPLWGARTTPAVAVALTTCHQLVAKLLIS